MVVNSKQLLGLPVFTRSGVHVGKVAGFLIETDTGRLSSLSVKARGLVPGLLDQELAVAWSQVVELTNERAVVEDGAIPVRARALAVRPTATGGGIHMSTRNSAVAGDDA